MTLPYPELARILRSYGLLLHSGIGTAEASFLLAREEQSPLAELLEELGKEMDKGEPMSEALAGRGVFPEQVAAMVAVGEETGRLEQALNALADYYEERDRSRQQIRSALAYPAMVFLLMLLVVGVLLVKVLPVFDRVYGSLGSSLTGPAAGLLYAGEVLEMLLPGIFLFLLVLAGFALVLKLRPRLREILVSRWRKKFGDRGISRKFNNARFARAMALGLGSGLSPERSLSLAQGLLQDVPGAARRCAACAKALEAGEDLGPAMEKAELLPPAKSRMLQIGFRGGNADQVMVQIAASMDQEARQALENAISAIEPAMVLASSLLVGLILLSVMLPLADILAVLG